MTTVRPLNVVYCLAFPRLSRTLLGTVEAGIRSTWLARNSSDPAKSVYRLPDSRSFEVKSTSVVGTSSI